MKALLILRAVAIALAGASLLLSLLTVDSVHDRLQRTGKIAFLGALGAQLAAELDHVLGRRSPWTRLLLPLAGVAIAVRTVWSGAFPVETYVVLGAIELALFTGALVVVVRALRRQPETYPEDALERELDRYAPAALNRWMAIELVVMASALRYVFGGFRKPLPPGFSYVRRWDLLPLVLAIPVLTIPEMLVLDFALWNAPGWRLGSDIVHVYLILWCFGIVATARMRPHRCDAERVRLRFGCVRRLDLERANIANVTVHGAVSDGLRRTLKRGGDAFAMILDGVPAVELSLRNPIVVRSPFGREREVRRVFVAVDEPRAFAAALAA